MAEIIIPSPAPRPEGVISEFDNVVSSPTAATSSTPAVSEALSGTGSQGTPIGDDIVLNEKPTNPDLEKAVLERDQAIKDFQSADKQNCKFYHKKYEAERGVQAQKEKLNKIKQEVERQKNNWQKAKNALKSAKTEEEIAKATGDLGQAAKKYNGAKNAYKTAAKQFNILVRNFNKLSNLCIASNKKLLKSKNILAKADAKVTKLGGTTATETIYNYSNVTKKNVKSSNLYLKNSKIPTKIGKFFRKMGQNRRL